MHCLGWSAVTLDSRALADTTTNVVPESRHVARAQMSGWWHGRADSTSRRGPSSAARARPWIRTERGAATAPGPQGGEPPFAPRAPDKVRVNVNTGESATGAIVHKDGDLKDRPTRVPWFVPFVVGNLP